jgi:hypothetical protein
MLEPAEYLLRFLIASKDAPEAARDEAAAILKALDQTDDLHRDAVKRRRTIANELTEAHRKAGSKIVTALLDAKKPNLGTLSDQIALLTTGDDDAERQAMLAKRGRDHAEMLARSLPTRHREALIGWVATRRVIEPHRCGFTDEVPRELANLWEALDVQMFPKWPEELHVPESWHRLPIVLDSMWPAEPRAGIAWCWKQIAEARWEWAPHPGDRQRKPRLMRFTHLPTDIEPAPTIPRRPERGLRFGIGSA